MAMSSSIVGAWAAIAALCLLVVTGMMEDEENSYWELELQQILQREMLLGDQIQNMLAWIAAGSLIVLRRGSVLSSGRNGTVKQARR